MIKKTKTSIIMPHIIVSIPHAGTEIPSEIQSLILHSDREIRNESDLYTDQIYDLPGTEIIKTPYSRIISDVNRAPDEIYIHGKDRATGVIMLDLPTGQALFASDPSLKQLKAWVKAYHQPFHQSLARACKSADFLIDAHSMWSKSVAGHWGNEDAGKPRADILIGNQYFTSCDAETTEFFIQYFKNLGYSVSLNDPYPGRFILGAYCQRDHLPGIQIEINRRLYLDENTLQPYPEKITQLNQELQDLITTFGPWFKNHRQSKLVDMS